jgi:NCAIR mutase (PurE)-related protein
MDRAALEKLLEDVREGRIDVGDATERLASLKPGDLGFAKLDHHRTLRRGMPEVVYGEGKSREHILKIVEHLVQRDAIVLVSRVDPSVGAELASTYPDGRHDTLSRTFLRLPSKRPELVPGLLIISAGTADLPVAEEAAISAEALGLEAERLYDVGVAGVHRVLGETDRIRAAKVVVVVAGMEGALPSVVAGIVEAPVIGVPTSVGYGVARGGTAALHGMLSSCAGGLTVVNIDNGYGAAAAAHAILRPRRS